MNWLLQTCLALGVLVRSLRSPLIKAPAHRTLFLVVMAGMLFICMVPEAAFVIPALDAVGLDIVTILVAFELRHYVVILARLAGLPTSVDGIRRVLGPSMNRCIATLLAPTNPNLWPYACMSLLLVVRKVLGVKWSPQSEG